MEKKLITDCYELTVQDNVYRFTTEENNIFEVTFTKNWIKIIDLLSLENKYIELFEFQFERIKISSKKFDRKISLSILNATLLFLNENKIAFYSADNPTKRDKELFVLYNIWYRNAIASFGYKIVIKFDKKVIFQGNELFFSCFFLNTSVFVNMNVEELFHKILEELYPNSEIFSI